MYNRKQPALFFLLFSFRCSGVLLSHLMSVSSRSSYRNIAAIYVYAKCTKTIISGRSITISLSWFCYLCPHYFNIPAPMQVFRERLFPQEHTTHLQQRGTCLQNPSHRQKQKAQHVNFGKLMGGRKRVAKTPARCTRTAMPRHASVSLFILSPLVCLCLQTIRGTLVYAGRWGELNICSQCQRQT